MGPKDVEGIKDIKVAGGGESVPATSRRDRGKAPGKKTRVEQRYGPPRPGKAAENAHMDVEAFDSPESSTPVDSWRGDTFFHVADPRDHSHADGHHVAHRGLTLGHSSAEVTRRHYIRPGAAPIGK